MRRIIHPPPEEQQGLRLRAATKQDVPFIRELSVEVFTQFGDYGAFLPPYLSHPSVFTCICEQQEQPLGFLMLALVLSEQPLPGYQGAPTASVGSTPRWLDAEIIAIAVEPEQQARGVGRRLMQHALEFARAWRQSSGVRSVQLNVADTNHRAMDFFARAGFQVVDPDDGAYPEGQRSIRMAHLLD